MSTMEVDSPQEEESKKVSVHPLAIVNMSDQYTRITCGGSALSKDAPVVGLLFGHTHNSKDGGGSTKSSSNNNNNTAAAVAEIQILDADDIPTDRSEAAKTQISLHHAVFPLHDVVGWYRVGSSEEPTAHDLQLTQELKEHYCSGTGDGGDSKKTNKPFFFSLLQVKQQQQSSGNKKNNNNMKDNEENDDDEDELPLNLYEIQIHDGSAVLVGVENWSLQTSEAERIAVERVVREQPQQDLKAGSSSMAFGGAKEGGGPEDETTDSAHHDAMISASSSQPSQYVNYMTSVQSSLQAMDDRIKIIIDYLERVGKGEIPPDYSLLRQIQGLTLQLGPLQQAAPKAAAAAAVTTTSTTTTTKDAELFSHLAAVAKTVQAVHSYTEKFRTLHENRPSGGGGGGGHHREGRRGY